MNQEQIPYQEVIILGFKREEAKDNVFFKQNGYHPFYVTKRINKEIQAVWDCETKTVDLVRYDHEENMQARLPIPNIISLRKHIEFFRHKNV